MDTKQREQIKQGKESCKQIIRTFKGILAMLEIAELNEDIKMVTDQINALNKEAKQAKATVHDINEARQATKQ